MNKTKQTSIIRQHDSRSWFCLFLYNRLTLTVLKPHSMALAQHDRYSCGTNKTLSQLTYPTYLPPSPPPPALFPLPHPPFFVIYKQSLPLITMIFSSFCPDFLRNNKMHDQQI